LSSGGATIYAIIETGGKQYKVSPGESLKVESLEVAEGGTIEINRVLAIGDGDKLVLG
jgi:large subunit ribosomal protein L21